MSSLGQWLRGQGFVVDDNPVPGRQTTWTGVRTIMVHHTAGNESPANEANEARFARTGGSSPPLYHIVVGVSGRVWMICQQRSGQPEPGRASHAGEGGPAWGMPRDRANEMSLGVSMQCNGSHPLSTHRDAYQILVRLLAALCNRYGLTPAAILGHKEWTPRKIDPRDDMAVLRADVQRALDSDTPDEPQPGPEWKEPGMLIQAPSRSWWLLSGERLVSITAQAAQNGRAGGLAAWAADSASWANIVAAYVPPAGQAAMLAEGAD